MDPITIGALIMIGSLALGTTCGVSGAAIQRFVHRRSSGGGDKHKARRLELENKKLKEINSAQAEDVERERKARKQQEEWKNEYRLIAQSHEVKLPELGDRDIRTVKVNKRIWNDNRLYKARVSKVLELLEKDLKPYCGRRVCVDIEALLKAPDIVAMWSTRRGESWGSDKVSTSLCGLAEDIPELMGQWMDTYKLFHGWRKEGATLGFNIGMRISEERAVIETTPPEVQTVQVAVVEEVIVQREVERVRYVVWDEAAQAATVVDDEPRLLESTPAALHLTQEELIGVVQSVVEIELDSRGGSAKAPTSQELAEVRARAKAAASQAMAAKAQAAGGSRG